MGVPYSRQINAAFEEVTPLVAAGFKVLRTTRNISVLLAVIQVLTVFFLFLILLGLIALLYCVNPDLEYERVHLVTPWLRRLAGITIWGVVRSVGGVVGGVAVGGYVVWRGVGVKRWVEDVEFEGNVDADEALENLPDLERKEEEEKVKEEEERRKAGEEQEKKEQQEKKKTKGKKK